MAIQIQGNSGTVAETETNTRAQRVTVRPIDIGSNGAFGIAMNTGSIAAGAQTTQPIFGFRWTNASNVALIKVVTVSLYSQGTGFTAGLGGLFLDVARSWTVDFTVGTVQTVTGNNQKVRTSHATSLVGSIRASATAVLSGQTYTLDSQSFGNLHFNITVATNTVFQATTALWAAGGAGGAGGVAGAWPIVLAQNEGVVLRATVPATGIWSADCSIQWEEVASF